MISSDIWNGVEVVIHVLKRFNAHFYKSTYLETLLSAFSRVLYVFCDAFSDSELASSLADFCQISTREALGNAGKMFKVDIGGNWRFSEVSLENRQTRKFVRQWNVHQLIQSTCKRGLNLLNHTIVICF